MGCPAQVNIGDDLVFSVCCHDPDTGRQSDADGVPEYRIYEDANETPILTGNMDSGTGAGDQFDDANTTGFYVKLIACTVANGFENGKTYTIYVTATVDTDPGGICYAFKAVTHTLDEVVDDLAEIKHGTFIIETAITTALSQTEFEIQSSAPDTDLTGCTVRLKDNSGIPVSDAYCYRKIATYSKTGATVHITLDAAIDFVIAIGDTVTIMPDMYRQTATVSQLATAAELAKVPKSDGTVSWNATAMQAVADEILKRGASNIEDSADKHSLGAVIMISTNSDISGGTLTAKKPSDDSTFYTYTVTSDASADNITGVS